MKCHFHDIKIFKEKENAILRLFITKKKLIKKFADELAYLQIRADWWYYCFPNEKVDENITKQDMSNKELDAVTELRCICHSLGILSEVYDEAYKIYDFRNSGKKNCVPDVELIKRLDREFCEPMKNKRPLI